MPQHAFSEEWDTRINKANKATGSGSGTGGGANEWLSLARQSFYSSTEYLNVSLRADWENAYRAFNNKHQSGSKYFSGEYAHRSKLFRPKTRSTIRKSEAAAAAAFFSRQDAVNIGAINDSDEFALQAARFVKELVNHRLGANGTSRDSIRWFQIVMGAWQTASIQGVCCSKQWWEYAQAPAPEPAGDDAPPENERQQRQPRRVIHDRPRIRLMPSENARIDPGADWIDPVNSSPYFIELIPMYVVDVLERMVTVDPKTGMPTWKSYDANTVKAATEQTFTMESTRQARENYRQDTKGTNSGITRVSDYEIVWVHENHVRRGGQDWVYWTLGTHELLTDPAPLSQVYPHCYDGMRPYVMGSRILEAHKPYPTSVPTLMSGVQHEINEIANARLDNVKLAVNGRVLVKRGNKVDLKALKKHVAGGTILAGDPEKDVKFERPPDVTRSSYEEQDRLSVEADDLTGGFSQSSVLSNRKLNETVGGMQMLNSSGNAMIDYDIRVFGETWMEPVMQQMIRMEQRYESDATIIALAAKRSNIHPGALRSPELERLFDEDLVASVNFGVGFANPEVQLERLGMALKMIIELIEADKNGMMKIEEIATEVFSKTGYKDGHRFFNFDKDSPEMLKAKTLIENIMKEMQQLEMKAAGHEIAAQSRIEVAKINQETDLKEAGYRAASGLQIEKVRGKNALDNELTKQGGEINMKILENPNLAGTLFSEMNREIAGQKEASDQTQQMMMQMMQALMMSMDSQRQAFEQLTQAILAPQHIIRDDQGRAVGSEKILPRANSLPN